MNKLMIGLAVGLGTFAIAEASKAFAEVLEASEAIAKQKAKQKAKQRAAKQKANVELGTYVIDIEKAKAGLAAAEKKMADSIANTIL